MKKRGNEDKLKDLRKFTRDEFIGLSKKSMTLSIQLFEL